MSCPYCMRTYWIVERAFCFNFMLFMFTVHRLQSEDCNMLSCDFNTGVCVLIFNKTNTSIHISVTCVYHFINSLCDWFTLIIIRSRDHDPHISVHSTLQSCTPVRIHDLNITFIEVSCRWFFFKSNV